ncbi:hypothetical protein EON66_03720, partial [archaeon]
SDADDSAGGSQAAYIAAMRKAQRKRRAAAKRALATRKREEAVRSAALRRGGDLDAGASTAVDEGEVSLFFPTFLWVLRDFTLDLLDDEGVRMSPLDYLESCLQPQNGFSSDAQARNRTRRVLLSFFKVRTCSCTHKIALWSMYRTTCVVAWRTCRIAIASHSCAPSMMKRVCKLLTALRKASCAPNSAQP